MPHSHCKMLLRTTPLRLIKNFALRQMAGKLIST